MSYYAESRYAECRYAEDNYADCRGVNKEGTYLGSFWTVSTVETVKLIYNIIKPFKCESCWTLIILEV